MANDAAARNILSRSDPSLHSPRSVLIIVIVTPVDTGLARRAAAAAGAFTRSMPFSSRVMDGCCIGLMKMVDDEDDDDDDDDDDEEDGKDDNVSDAVDTTFSMYQLLTPARYTLRVVLPTDPSSATDANHCSAFADVSDDGN